ncbi:hypothetical protein [Novosphingobium sp. 9U]|uniref:NAD(P)H-dependent amine dehydrogenase family protein n=1 Tax=Novosphingobium sp. 9U TaxID=2653158 RepID=UPI0012F43EDF|nr:hypothetical protein [Novosphingobium sp. 9U]VWX54288.1 conserved hypothetical protein [Novosphingobium sp. 9U]
MDKLKVIQWNTGKVGKLALRAILDDPRLELVGVFAHSADKVGVDAGTLCGRPQTGVLATSDIDALLALKPDSVVYTPFTGDVDQTVRLLESGADVVSTNLFFHVGGIQGEVRERLEAACQRGNSSLYISGINPGWINAIAIAQTAVCRDVQSLTLIESADCSVYESVETWSFLGMGEPEATDETRQAAQTWLVMFRDVAVRMGEALGYTFDDVEFFIEYASAAERVDLGWFVMEKGSNAALRGGWRGKVGGKTVITATVVWYLTRKLVENWEIDDDQHRVIIEGEPNVDTRVRYTPPSHWGNHEWDTMTALPAVNALHQIKAARPGVLGLLDVGLPHAPAAEWSRLRGG